jgi:hypothetical protein
LIDGGGLAERLGLILRVYRTTRCGDGRLRWRSGYPVTPNLKKVIWDPYMCYLLEAFRVIRQAESGFDAGVERASFQEIHVSLRTRLRSVYDRIRRRSHV